MCPCWLSCYHQRLRERTIKMGSAAKAHALVYVARVSLPSCTQTTNKPTAPPLNSPSNVSYPAYSFNQTNTRWPTHWYVEASFSLSLGRKLRLVSSSVPRTARVHESLWLINYLNMLFYHRGRVLLVVSSPRVSISLWVDSQMVADRQTGRI
jgi:hypothetical protein